MMYHGEDIQRRVNRRTSSRKEMVIVIAVVVVVKTNECVWSQPSEELRIQPSSSFLSPPLPPCPKQLRVRCCSPANCIDHPTTALMCLFWLVQGTDVKCDQFLLYSPLRHEKWRTKWSRLRFACELGGRDPVRTCSLIHRRENSLLTIPTSS